MNTETKPVVAVTLGDPAGIGPELIARLFPEDYRARPEAAILFKVEAWDANCPQHIPQMLVAEDVAAAIERLNERIAALEAENARLREQAS